MSHAATLPGDRSTSRPGTSVILAALLAVWLGSIYWLGATEAFVTSAGAPPLRLLAVVLGPVLAALAAYRLFPAVRELALAADLRFLTATQAWRFGGFAFLALYSYGVLPAYFAWPAGLGDMAVAAAVPWMLAGLARKPGFGSSRAFVTWNLLGILDLVVAVSLGATVPLLFPGAAGAVPPGAMARLPLAVIPGFGVPLYIIMHLTALAQARRAVTERRPA